MANQIFTCTLEPENRKILEKKKATEGCKLGETVNTLIATFGLLPKTIQNDLLTYVKGRLRVLSAQAEVAGEYEKETIMQISQKYHQIALYLNNGNEVTTANVEIEHKMKKINIQDGILRCPEDYCIVNLEEAARMPYACVIECRNSANYGVPHYLVFCDRKYGSEYDEEYKSMILQKVLKKDPRFQKIIDLQVLPLENPEVPGTYLNIKEFVQSPEIGLFHVYERGDPTYPPDYKPPYGVEIVREKNNTK